MEQFGTMKNGVIVPDEPGAFQEGERVILELAEDDWPADAFPPTDTYEEHLEKLRHSIAEMQAGVPGKPIAEFAAELKHEFGPPYSSSE